MEDAKKIRLIGDRPEALRKYSQGQALLRATKLIADNLGLSFYRMVNASKEVTVQSIPGVQSQITLSVEPAVPVEEEIIKEFLIPVMGVMAQFENGGKIFFESHDPEAIEDVFIDLTDHTGLYDPSWGARLVRLYDDDAWTGVIIFHKHSPPYNPPGEYNLVFFQIDKPSDPEVKIGKFRKYGFFHKEITVPDTDNSDKAPLLTPILDEGLILTGHIGPQNPYCKLIIIGVRLWWENGTKKTDKKIGNLKYELVARIHPGIDQFGYLRSWVIGIFLVGYSQYDYNLQLITRTRTTEWGPWEDPVGYKGIRARRFYNGEPPPYPDEVFVYPDFGGLFIPHLIPLTFSEAWVEYVRQIHECYFTVDGKMIITFTSVMSLIINYGDENLIQDMPDEFLYCTIYGEGEPTSQILGLNILTEEERVGAFTTLMSGEWGIRANQTDRVGTYYFHTMQKGGGYRSRKMFRTVADDLVYFTPALHVKDERGTVWQQGPPGMKVFSGKTLILDNSFGPSSKEIIIPNIQAKIPVCDSIMEEDRAQWLTRTLLTGKFLHYENLDGVCEFSYGADDMTYGTGMRQADYSVRRIEKKAA